MLCHQTLSLLAEHVLLSKLKQIVVGAILQYQEVANLSAAVYYNRGLSLIRKDIDNVRALGQPLADPELNLSTIHLRNVELGSEDLDAHILALLILRQVQFGLHSVTQLFHSFNHVISTTNFILIKLLTSYFAAECIKLF